MTFGSLIGSWPGAALPSSRDGAYASRLTGGATAASRRRSRVARVACAVVPSIGVMREGSLHASVKALLAEPGDRLEVPVGRFVVDLVRADGELVEVQTGGFGAL